MDDVELLNYLLHFARAIRLQSQMTRAMTRFHTLRQDIEQRQVRLG